MILLLLALALIALNQQTLALILTVIAVGVIAASYHRVLTGNDE